MLAASSPQFRAWRLTRHPFLRSWGPSVRSPHAPASIRSFFVASNRITPAREIGRVYVLHCFQKKSTRGIATPKPDLDLIEARLKAVATQVKE